MGRGSPIEWLFDPEVNGIPDQKGPSPVITASPSACTGIAKMTRRRCQFEGKKDAMDTQDAGGYFEGQWYDAEDLAEARGFVRQYPTVVAHFSLQYLAVMIHDLRQALEEEAVRSTTLRDPRRSRRRSTSTTPTRS